MLVRVAARSGAVAALAGLVTAVVVSVVCWLPDAGVSGKAGSALKAGLLSFLAAHHGGITVDRVPATLLPLGLFLGVALFISRAGATIAQAANDVSTLQLIGAVVVAALVYAGCVTVLVPLSRLGTSHVSIVTTPIAAFIVFVVIATIAVVREFPATVTPWLLGAGRGALAATSLYLAAGAVLVAGSLVLHAHRVTEISREVGGGLSGLPVLVIGVLFAPNAAIAGSAYLAGPGFAVGTGTSVNAFSTSHGVLPALPILGAIPDGHGANPVVLALMSIVPLLAATCIARAVRRAIPAGFTVRVGSAAASAALAGVAMAAAAGLAGGRAGTGRLRTIGASPWQVGLAVAAVLAVLSVLAVIVLAAWDHFVPPVPRDAPADDATADLDLVGAR